MTEPKFRLSRSSLRSGFVHSAPRFFRVHSIGWHHHGIVRATIVAAFVAASLLGGPSVASATPPSCAALQESAAEKIAEILSTRRESKRVDIEQMSKRKKAKIRRKVRRALRSEMNGSGVGLGCLRCVVRQSTRSKDKARACGSQGIRSTVDCEPSTITFGGLAAGTIVSSVEADDGTGPVAVNASNPALKPGENAAVIFDSSCDGGCSGNDNDLGSPNKDYDGPGRGAGGSNDAAHTNSTALGNILIVAENLIDEDGDDLVDDPGDQAGRRVTVHLDFSEVGTVAVESLTVIDIESKEEGGVAELLGKDGNVLDRVALPITGNNGVATVEFSRSAGAVALRVELRGSAGLDNVVFRREVCTGPTTTTTMPAPTTTTTTLPQAGCGDGVLGDDEQCESDSDCDQSRDEQCNQCRCEASATSVYSIVDECVAVGVNSNGASYLVSTGDGTAFSFTHPTAEGASAFVLKAADLGIYILRDEEGAFLVAEDDQLLRRTELQSDVTLLDDSYVSEAEWKLELADGADGDFRLLHVKSGKYLTADGLAGAETEGAAVTLAKREGCLPYPELSSDATGNVEPRSWEDGSVFGFVDAHSHILSNFGFGGGGIYHGEAFHRLGVEHALRDCTRSHGEEGRRDIFGFGFDAGANVDPGEIFFAIGNGFTREPNHNTTGYPEFIDWPNAHSSSTHQVQYYKWLERAYLGGLRLVVQHATTNQIICDFISALAEDGMEPVRYSCNDMVAVDRIIDETYNMERYIDAQEGGPGKGWFRIVSSPAEAREVINGGKMAVILGIETSNLFDCFLTPPDGFEPCTPQSVKEKLDAYYERGVRVIFPVHKYDNAFSAGDGDKVFIELGNFIQTEHFNNFTLDCDDSIPTVFDKGDLFVPGWNRPRDDYLAPAPHDLSGFKDDPLMALQPFLPLLAETAEPGSYCQNAGLTDLGEFLVNQVMSKGMILEIDHLPRRSYKKVFEMLVDHDYPAAGTHGNNNHGKLYELGGVSTTGFGRCRNPNESGTVDDGFQNKIRLIEERGGFPAEGFGLDLNGFAGAPGPRFGDNSVCSAPQSDPLTYPFTSYAGDVTFEQPRAGNRVIDFNTDGLAHIGLLPDLIEDVRRDGVSDEDLAPLFKSAEAYLRMWEKAESRGAAIRSE